MEYVNKFIFSQNKFETVIKDDVEAENKAKEPKILEKIEKNKKPYKEPTNLHMFLRDCKLESPEPAKGKIEGVGGYNGAFQPTSGSENFLSPFPGPQSSVRTGLGTQFRNCDALEHTTYLLQYEGRFASFFEKGVANDNCLVTVYPFNDELYAMTETLVVHRVDPQTLDSIKRVRKLKLGECVFFGAEYSNEIVDEFADYPKEGISVNLKHYVSIVHHTAHPHLDDDGTVYSLGITSGKGGVEYAIIEFPNSKRGSKTEDVFSEGKIAAKVPTRWRFSPCYMHSFGMSPNYFVIIEQPLGMSLITQMVGSVVARTFSDGLKWYDEPTLIHVVSRETGSLVSTYEAEPFGFFHTINQFEEDGNVVIDICCYKDMALLDKLTDQGLEDFQKNPKFANDRGRPARFVCPLDPPKRAGNLVNLAGSGAKAHWNGSKVQVTAEILLGKSCEMPRINYDKFNGKKYQYFYCFAGGADDDVALSASTLEKVDVLSKTSLTWSGEGVYPSEPIFVPRPESEEEDDGVLLSSLLYGEDENKISLLVLDAKNMRQLAKVDFETPSCIPAGFHGWFMEDNA